MVSSLESLFYSFLLLLLADNRFLSDACLLENGMSSVYLSMFEDLQPGKAICNSCVIHFCFVNPNFILFFPMHSSFVKPRN